MKNYNVFVLMIFLFLLSCGKGGGNGDDPVEPNYDATITQLISTMNGLDNIIENGNYSSLANLMSNPVDTDFLSGSILSGADSYTTFTITSLSKNTASNPSMGNIILEGTGEFIVLANPNERHLIDFKIRLNARSNYENAVSYKIASIEQSNIRTVTN